MLRALLLACAVIGALSSCSLDRRFSTLGGSLAQGALAHINSDSGRRELREIADSSARAVGAAYQAHLQPRVDTIVGRLSTSGYTFVRSAPDTLAVALEGRLGRSIGDILRANLRGAGEESRRQLQLAIQEAAVALRVSLVPVAGDAARGAAHEAAGEVLRNLGPEFRVAVDSIVASAVRAGVQEGTREARRSTVWRVAVGLGVAFIVALFALAGAWLWRDRRRARAALSAVAEVLHDDGNPELTARVKSQAQARRVESYLDNFLAKKH